MIQGRIHEVEIYHVNPFAFLSHAIQTSPLFENFLRSLVGAAPGGTLDFIFYLDKAKPGNQQRPDDGRTAQCLYWSILQFPMWFRSRRCGWIPFGYVLAKSQKEAALTDSMLVKYMHKVFDDSASTPNFGDGCAFESATGLILYILARCRIMVADWEQHVKTFSLTGYNGSVCCGVCANVLGRCDPFVHPYLVHYQSHEYHKFVRRTPASLKDDVDQLRHVAMHTPNQLAREQQVRGVKYEPDGVMFDDQVRSKMEPPYCEVTDWMHTFCASGGIAQYEVNQFCCSLISKTPLELKDIDDWKNKVVLPRGLCRLTKDFFATRTVLRVNAHMRAFASEILTAVVVLGFFIDAVVVDVAKTITELSEYIDCFALLRILLNVFERGDLKDLGVAREAMHAHHVLFAKLYPQCMKAKIHAQVHVPDFWELWKALLSCFGPERHHRIMKQCMSFSYKKPCQTSLAYDVRKWFKDVTSPTTFMPIYLAGTVRQGDYSLDLPGYPELTITAWAGSLQCESGMLSKKDVLQWDIAGRPVVGIAIGFASTTLAYAQFVALVHTCRQDPACPVAWLTQTTSIEIINANSIIGSVPYILHDHYIVPLLHSRR